MLPYAERHYPLNIDRCNAQIGCILMQGQIENTMKLIGYLCRSLLKVEKAYGKTERESMAIVWQILFLWLYLESSRFIARKDQQSLYRILNLTYASEILSRRQLFLTQFDFNAVYRSGFTNQPDDALSRLSTKNVKPLLVDDLAVMYIREIGDG